MQTGSTQNTRDVSRRKNITFKAHLSRLKDTIQSSLPDLQRISCSQAPLCEHHPSPTVSLSSARKGWVDWHMRRKGILEIPFLPLYSDPTHPVQVLLLA